MSDGVAIDQLDAMTGDRTVSGAVALEAGVDMGLWDTGFAQLEEAVERGLVSGARLDEAVLRILELKFRRGLFEEPFVAEHALWQGYTPARYPQARELTRESMVLLKNEQNLLPLDGTKPLRLLVTGPNADDIYCQLGDYTPPVRPEAGVTVRRGLEQWAAGTPVQVAYAPGCPAFGSDPDLMEQAVEAAREADVIVADESRENFLDQLSLDALCSKQDDFSMTYEFKMGDRILYHQTRIAYVYKKDRSRVAVIGTRNIDDLIKKERMQEAKLKEAYIVAEEANKAKTDFLNNMSHDIRTPMNVILGYNELMKQYLTDPILVDYQNKIEQSGKLLLSIINNVLDMARIESGKMVVEERAEQIGLVVEEIESVFESSAQEKNIVFTTSVDVDHTHVLWDGFKVREILMNLVGNAFKYTPDGGHIAIDVKELDCTRSGYVRIQTQIKDTGIGMSEDYLPTLFDSFSREYNTTIGKVSGTGLGMAIVKNLVDMMDGEICVKSKLGEGTCFTLTFEHRIADEECIEMNQELDVLDEKSILQGKHVLLVEDNDLNAEIAMAILEQSGLVLDRVEDGLACVNRLSEVDADLYDLILMDIQMPNMNGYEATRRIRQFENVKKASIPILAMTANAFEEDKKMAMEAGMNGHISKPIDVNVLENEIINIFKKVS